MARDYYSVLARATSTLEPNTAAARHALYDRARLTIMDAGLASSETASERSALEAAIDRISHAMRLSPYDPYIFGTQSAMASAHLAAGRYAEALFWAEKASRVKPDYLLAACIVAASRALAGRIEEARNAVATLRRLDPELRLSNLKSVISYLQTRDFEKWADGLRMAGLPE